MLIMKVRVFLPNFLKNPGKSNEFELEFEQKDVKLIDVLLELEKLFPDAKGRIVPGGKPNRFINYSINDEDARFLQSGATPLKDGDSVTLLSAIAGG